MKFKLVSNKHRQVSLNMGAINAYTQRYKKFTPFDFEIVRRVAKKSDPQRHYYWAVVIRTYAEHIGYDADELETFHKQLKIIYFNIKPEPVKSDTIKAIYKNIPSVFSNESEYDVQERSKFIEWVIRMAARDGVYIPNANE